MKNIIKERLRNQSVKSRSFNAWMIVLGIVGIPVLVACSLGFIYCGLVCTQALFQWPEATDWKTVLLTWALLWIIGLIVRGWRAK